MITILQTHSFAALLLQGFFIRGRHSTYPQGVTPLNFFQPPPVPLQAMHHYQSVKVHDVGTASDDALTIPYNQLEQLKQNRDEKDPGDYFVHALLSGSYGRVYINTETGDACIVPEELQRTTAIRLNEIAMSIAIPAVTRGAEKHDIEEKELRKNRPNLYGSLDKPNLSFDSWDLKQGTNLWCLAALIEAVADKTLVLGIRDGVANWCGYTRVRLYDTQSSNAYFALVDAGLAGPSYSEDENSRYLVHRCAELVTAKNKAVGENYMQNLTRSWVTKKLAEFGIPVVAPAGPLSRDAVSDAAELFMVHEQQNILRTLFPLAQHQSAMQQAMSNAAHALQQR